MLDVRVSIIGCGNMGSVLVEGLCSTNLVSPDNIIACDSNTEKGAKIEKLYNVRSCTDVEEAFRNSDVSLLAVKPQRVMPVLESASRVLNEGHSLKLISLITGIRIEKIQKICGDSVEIVRVMPNLAASVGYGMTGIYAKHGVSSELLQMTEQIFGSVGETIVLNKEEHLDAVTALGGSGPAFIFAVAEALVDGAVKKGLRNEEASRIVNQVLLGSAMVLKETGERPGVLIAKVASPGGTTEAGLGILNSRGLHSILVEAISSATTRAKELS